MAFFTFKKVAWPISDPLGRSQSPWYHHLLAYLACAIQGLANIYYWATSGAQKSLVIGFLHWHLYSRSSFQLTKLATFTSLNFFWDTSGFQWPGVMWQKVLFGYTRYVRLASLTSVVSAVYLQNRRWNRRSSVIYLHIYMWYILMCGLKQWHFVQHYRK